LACAVGGSLSAATKQHHKLVQEILQEMRVLGAGSALKIPFAK
jgi:hypothetical protein